MSTKIKTLDQTNPKPITIPVKPKSPTKTTPHSRKTQKRHQRIPSQPMQLSMNNPLKNKTTGETIPSRSAAD
jgi:hypothetical protein